MTYLPGDVFVKPRIGFFVVRRINEDGTAWVSGPCTSYGDVMRQTVTAPVSFGFLASLERVVTMDTTEGVACDWIGWHVPSARPWFLAR